MNRTTFDLDGGTLTIEDDRLTVRLTMADVVGALTDEQRAGMRAYFTDADEIRAFTTRLSLGDCFYYNGDAEASDARAKFLDEIGDGHTHDLHTLRLAAESAKERANTLSANIEAWLDKFNDGMDTNRMRESFRSFCIQRAYAAKG